MSRIVWGAGLGLALLALTAGGRADLKPRVESSEPGVPEEGFTSLFNGKDLTGWRCRSPRGRAPTA